MAPCRRQCTQPHDLFALLSVSTQVRGACRSAAAAPPPLPMNAMNSRRFHSITCLCGQARREEYSEPLAASMSGSTTASVRYSPLKDS